VLVAGSKLVPCVAEPKTLSRNTRWLSSLRVAIPVRIAVSPRAASNCSVANIARWRCEFHDLFEDAGPRLPERPGGRSGSTPCGTTTGSTMRTLPPAAALRRTGRSPRLDLGTEVAVAIQSKVPRQRLRARQGDGSEDGVARCRETRRGLSSWVIRRNLMTGRQHIVARGLIGGNSLPSERRRK